MKKLAFLLAAAAAFGLGGLADHLGAVGGAGLSITLGVVLAVLASETPSLVAAGAGALGAFASGVLAGASPAVAGAALLGLCFAERTTRIRTPIARLLHLGVAVGTGALAGSLATAFSASSLSVRGVAITVGAVLAALPMLVEADPPEAHALETAANDLPEPVRATLLRGAELRRGADDSLLDRDGRKLVKSTWKALRKLVDARVRLEGARIIRARAKVPREIAAHANLVVEKVDERITKHVDAIARAYSAASSADAATKSLDDEALRGVEEVGDNLEEVSKAIVEDAA